MRILVIHMALSSKSALFLSILLMQTQSLFACTSRLYTMVPNFTACKIKFYEFSSNNSTYNFTGKVHGILSDRARRPPLTTYEGCNHFCGTGTQYYAWADISSTITTWVMVTARFFSQHPLILCLQVFPVVGLLLQAPFESNKNFSTLFALARWLGNPIAGISYTFWNIGVIGRCALMVDMATPYDEVPDPGSHFAQIRDSLYLLSVMNQCTYLRGLIS